MAVALRARAREMVLIDRDQARAKAVATDMHYGEPLSALLEIRDGDYRRSRRCGRRRRHRRHQ
jgi:hypothetical protein